MGFDLAVVGGLLALFLVFWYIGKYSAATPAEYLDWKPTRSPELEIELELDDVHQMIEAQNERRRRDGRPLIDEDAYRNQVEMWTPEERESARDAKRPDEKTKQRWADKERRGF
ncbi:MAG: hypothetical protein QOJ12_3187 [Thermoleophilales bacterium]|nr:hypothetical protein [Thermoleophilales bacterium]